MFPGPVRSGSRSREALLDAAEGLFASRGYDAVGIREITDNAGVNIAAIKHHFGSKSGLYLETVKRAVARSHAHEVWGALEEAPTSQRDAAQRLARFLHAFVARMLDCAEASSVCSNFIMKEAVAPSEACNAVVDHYIRPNQELLSRTVAAIAPGLAPDEAARAGQGILAQALHYKVFRPFLTRMWGASLGAPGGAEQIADGIVRFSLRGLGCPASLIEEAASAALGERAAQRAED